MTGSKALEVLKEDIKLLINLDRCHFPPTYKPSELVDMIIDKVMEALPEIAKAEGLISIKEIERRFDATAKKQGFDVNNKALVTLREMREALTKRGKND